MIIVGSRFHGEIDKTPSCPLKLRSIIAGLNRKLFYRFHAGPVHSCTGQLKAHALKTKDPSISFQDVDDDISPVRDLSTLSRIGYSISHSINLINAIKACQAKAFCFDPANFPVVPPSLPALPAEHGNQEQSYIILDDRTDISEIRPSIYVSW
jgi:hypothetical protein